MDTRSSGKYITIYLPTYWVWVDYNQDNKYRGLPEVDLTKYGNPRIQDYDRLNIDYGEQHRSRNHYQNMNWITWRLLECLNAPSYLPKLLHEADKFAASTESLFPNMPELELRSETRKFIKERLASYE